MREARSLQQVLQRVEPCEVVALHQGRTQGSGHTVIVCDVALDLPKSLELLREALAQHRLTSTTPVLFLLRDPSHVTVGQARLAGATATLEHPVAPDRLLNVVSALMEPDRKTPSLNTKVRAALTGARDTSKALTTLFQAGAAGQGISADTLERGATTLLGVVQQASVQAWLDVVWRYDDATYQHCLLVAGLATAFGYELGLPPATHRVLAQAALVHDIGKARVPRHILNKTGPLTPPEMSVMRRHAMAGYRMLAGQPGLDPTVLDATRHHHEYLDGTGYPDGLSSEQISRLVRIVTVCDIYAALIERRAYRESLPPQEALGHLDDLGPKLDQRLVKAFRNVVRDT